ncbi:dynein axonemal intermediate chain 7 homolog isoform X2 [Lineus longissimus]|uniref:dynein axonemal intermediate chain 7 homolog isoform X2 n=1 Tax=Lineus longissimus TaxID=88925 RepID=UPI002B4C2A83
MPPKGKKGAPAGKGKPKKIDKEEEERRAREEEEARLRAEEEERERKEKEKREAEERRRLENEERTRRKAQLLELNSITESNETQLLNIHDNRRKKAKWARYMRCDGSPDPTIPGEINTYMNLWREDNERVTIDQVLKDSDLALALISELQFLLDDTPANEITEAEAERYGTTQNDLQDLLHEKLLRAEHELLLDSADRADPQTMNLQTVIENDLVSLCVWGNISKNPRIKYFEFADKGIGFDIPKLLTMTDCAVCFLFTKFDHFSQKCKSFLPRQKKKIVEEVEPPVVEEEEKTDGEEEKKEGEGEEEGGIEREETEDVMASLRKLDDDDEDKKEEEEVKVEEPEEEELVDDGDIKTPEPPEWEDFDGDEDVYDMRAYCVQGGLFHFNLLHMPPQPKNAKTWVMRQVVEPPMISHIEYMADTVNPALIQQQEDNNKEGEEGEVKAVKEEGKKRDERPPIGVSMKLPGDVVFNEEPQLGRWDYEQNVWRMDGFTDIVYNEDNRVVQFKTAFYGTMSLLSDTHINMPFQSWELRPRGMNHAQLTVIAAINECEIEIKDDKCCLNLPEEGAVEQLEHLRNKWMIPRDFIKAMRDSGVNIFPSEDSPKYVSIQSKNVITEERLYQQMALTSSAMAYSWSKWNAEVADNEKIVFQGAECLKDQHLLEEEWALFLVTKKRSMKLKMTEFEEAFSDDYAEGTNFHADMYHMVLELASEDALTRIRESSFKFIDCVNQLLTGTKLVTYS